MHHAPVRGRRCKSEEVDGPYLPGRNPLAQLVRRFQRLVDALVALNHAGWTRWLAPKPPEIPPLPTEARQGPVPSIFSATCSAALATELQSLRELQTVPVLRD